jgi:hypothetical protein
MRKVDQEVLAIDPQGIPIEENTLSQVHPLS